MGEHVDDSRSLPHLADALTLAVGQGALETAGRLAVLLAPSLSRLSGPVGRRACEDVLETLIIHGARDEACALACSYRSALSQTVKGASLLELLDLGDGNAWLPNGRPNMLGLSRRLERGQLSSRELVAIVARKPWLWLAMPELHLLMFAACRIEKHERALAHLNRFLQLNALPRLGLCEGECKSENVLGGLQATKVSARSQGPLVSIVMAARNAQATIGYALRSLSEQTYGSIEILVGDDASDDATLGVVRKLAATDSRIRLFSSSIPHGAYNVRNALARCARGELLTFHDADDFALPTRIASQVAVLRKGHALACVGSWLRVNADGRFVFFKNQKATRLSLVSLMLSRQLFFEHGCFRSARVGADHELYTRLRARLGAGSVIRLRAPLILGLWSAQSVTRQSGTEALEDGYRSPVRRSYSELVSRHASGSLRSDADYDARLRAAGNYAEPAEVTELVLD